MNPAHSNNDNDSLLLFNIREGCSESFNIFYKKYWKEVYTNAYKRLNDADQAKDIAQDIFINIWLNKETFIDNAPAYLSVAVRNRVFKCIDKQKKMSPFLDLLQEIPATYLAADANIRRQEFNKAYETLLNSLPLKRQIIFRLRFQENLSTKAIALQLGISQKTVQNQLGKATEHLRLSLTSFFTILFFLLDS